MVVSFYGSVMVGKLWILQKKLDSMLYVGLTENHKESANMFANVVGSQVISKHKISNSDSDGSGNKSGYLFYWTKSQVFL